MKTYGALMLLSLLGFSRLSFAQSFSARVDQSAVGMNENLNLKLELSDTQATTQPDLSEVEKSFQIIGQQQSSITNIINGESSSKTVWDVTLLQTQEGQAVIPSITIATNHGALKTEPVSIQVNQGMSSRQSLAAERGISFVARANKTELYKNEPTLVTFKLTSNRSLKNIQLGTLNVKDAIVEPQGQPKVQKEIVNGREQQVLLTSYLVTPLKDGILTIPSLVLRAETPAPQTTSHLRQRSNSFFGDDDEDPFAGMQKMMERFTQDSDLFAGFANMKPVSFASQPVHINVLPAVLGLNPWLPTTNLKLSETWSGDQPRSGEPFTRTIITEVSELTPSQLPGFEDQLKSNNDYKVYSDRPVTSTKEVRGQMESLRKDIFTIVPQKTGDIRLPALKLTWWDTRNHTQKVASVPERTVHVLSGTSNLVPSITLTLGGGEKNAQSLLAATVMPVSKNHKWFVIYTLLSVAIVLLIFLIREVFLMKKEKSKIQGTTAPKVVKTFSKSGLEKCASVSEVQQFLQLYAEEKWGVTANSSLSRIFAAGEFQVFNFDLIKAKGITKRMEETLYANKTLNLDELKVEVTDLIFKKNRASTQMKKQEYLPDLNPS